MTLSGDPFLFVNRLKGFKSGPSSMIELEDYEENDDICKYGALSLLSYGAYCPMEPIVLT